MENSKILNGKNDVTIGTMKEEKGLPYSELTGSILSCCFEVMRELGPDFFEKVYKNALCNEEYFDAEGIIESMTL